MVEHFYVKFGDRCLRYRAKKQQDTPTLNKAIVDSRLRPLRRRNIEQHFRQTSTKNLVKIASVGPEIFSRRDRQTDTQTY